MIRFLVLILIINLYSGEISPEVKNIDKHIQNQQIQQQFVHPDELLNKIKESKKKVKPKKRSIENGDHPKVDVKTNRSSRIHRDFTIYNFERIDEEIAVLRDEAIYTAEELGEIRSREEIYIEALEGLLLRNKRYDHFFTKWDDLKKSVGGILGIGGGSVGTIILGIIGLIVQKKRKKKKQNGGQS